MYHLTVENEHRLSIDSDTVKEKLTVRIPATLIQVIVLFMAVTFGSQSRPSPITIGETAPDFTLADQHGRPVTLSAALGKSPVVLVFYRGYW